MSKQSIKIGSDSRKKLIKGAKLLCDAVKSTLGPGGRNCVYNVDGKTKVTKDGVTVAKNVHPDDPVEAMGADIIRQAAERTAHVSGDGTSSSSVIAASILEEGFKALASGLNGISLQRGIMSAAKTVTEYIRNSIARPCTPEDIKHVALVSTNWDEEAADLIARAVVKVGAEGSITVTDSRTSESTLKFVDGLQVPRGFYSPYFVNNQAKQTVEYDNPVIFLSGVKIMNNQQLWEILMFYQQNFMQQGRPLLIIAPEVEAEPLNTMIINKLKGVINICAIKCPGFGDGMIEQMEDLEALLGGQYLAESLQPDFKNLSKEMFASCKKVIINRTDTIFTGGAGDKCKLAQRVEYLQELIKNDPTSWRAKGWKDRAAKLAEGVAEISIGATTEAELRERQDRVDDCVCSTRAAVEAGIVPGGGATLAKLSTKKLKFEYSKHDDAFNTGIDIVRKVLTHPLRCILENAGEGDNIPDIISKVVRKDANIGYDVRTKKYVDMITEGIVDPAKVTCTALENGASAAGLILTTECIIAKEATKEDSSSELVL